MTVSNDNAEQPPKRVRRKPGKLGEELRRLGIDEISVAKRLARLLKDDSYVESNAGVQTMLRTIQECVRHLGPARRPGQMEDEIEHEVELIHNVDRPQRDKEVNEEAAAHDESDRDEPSATG